MRDWKRFVRERLALERVRGESEESVIEELAGYLEDAYRDAIEAGATAEEADAHAQAGLAEWRELARELVRQDRVERTPRLEAWLEAAEGRARGRGGGWGWLADVGPDLRFAARRLRKSPGFAAIALLTLGLGIGAVTSIFSLINGVLLSPLPYPESGELLYLWEKLPSFNNASVSYPNFLDWRERNRSFEELAAFNDGQINLTGLDEPQELDLVRLSASLFTILRARPQIGRTFVPEEDRVGGERVVVLTAGFWKDRLGGAPDVIGRQLTLDGNPHTVIGVMPESFVFPPDGRPVDVYLPIEQFAERWIDQRGDHPGILLIGRLREGGELEQAREDMERVALELEAEYPDTNQGSRVHVASMHERITRDYEQPMALLLLAVGLLLLIACTNVANLLLARGTSRQREIAIRSSLGANGPRNVRLLLTESITLWLMGGLLGMLLASAATRALFSFRADPIPRVFEVGIDLRVVTATLLLALLTGLAFGLVPAIRAIRPDLVEHLKEGSRSSGGPVRNRLRSGLVVGEVTLAVGLLVAAGLTLRSFARMREADPGFDPNNVLVARINLPTSRYAEEAERTAFFYELLDRVRDFPGVESAATSLVLPMVPGGWQSSYHAEGEPPEEGGVYRFAEISSISSGYFQTLGVPLLRGRDFDRHDGSDAAPVVIVGERLAELHWPDEDPIGKRLKFGGHDSENPWMTVVGVAGHVKVNGVVNENFDQFYIPHAQDNDRGYFLAVRATLEPSRLSEPIRRAVRELDPLQPIAEINTLEAYVQSSTEETEFIALLLGVFAGSALLLAGVGLYGVTAQVTAERRHEMGVRIALGATSPELLNLVVRQGMARVSFGLVLGLLLAAAIGRVMASGLYGVSALDPLTYFAAAVFLGSVALGAHLVPARRALQLDPVRSLQAE